MLKSVAVILVVLSTSTLIISLVNARAMSCPMSGSVFDEKTNVKSEPEFPTVRDCTAWKSLGLNKSGIYPIKPDRNGDIFQVYCDMETDGGGWTVFQRRMDGSVDFYRGWSDYQYGFGELSGEYWLGLDKIHILTNNRPGETHELRVDMTTFKNETYFAQYSSFRVGDANSKYVMIIGGYYKGNGNALYYHNGRRFTTKDQDNDRSKDRNKAITCGGGFWYNERSDCYYASLNGKYLNTTKGVSSKAITWSITTSTSMKFTEMKIRRAN